MFFCDMKSYKNVFNICTLKNKHITNTRFLEYLGHSNVFCIHEPFEYASKSCLMKNWQVVVPTFHFPIIGNDGKIRFSILCKKPYSKFRHLKIYNHNTLRLFGLFQDILVL